MQITPLQINIAGISLQTNQPALTKFGRCEQYTINSMVYLIGLDEVDPVDRRYQLVWKRGLRGNRPSINVVLFIKSELKNGRHGYWKMK